MALNTTRHQNVTRTSTPTTHVTPDFPDREPRRVPTPTNLREFSGQEAGVLTQVRGTSWSLFDAVQQPALVPCGSYAVGDSDRIAGRVGDHVPAVDGRVRKFAVHLERCRFVAKAVVD